MFLSSLFLSAASAATFQVDPTGTCGTHTRISDAIADAGSGDTILITEGVHTENLGLVTDDLVFAPANLACTRDDSVNVRVDGGCLDRIATIGWGAHVRFEHLTLTNGCADDGGLLKVEVGSELALDSVGRLSLFSRIQSAMKCSSSSGGCRSYFGGAAAPHTFAPLDRSKFKSSAKFCQTFSQLGNFYFSKFHLFFAIVQIPLTLIICSRNFNIFFGEDQNLLDSHFS